jgi:large conductance mechanosensitive channel
MLKEFAAFLKEYKVVGLAIGFIMGAASTSLIKSLVNDVLMPIAAPLLSSESWGEAILQIGPVKIAYGSFIAELLNFLILALIVFIVTKKILKMEARK